MVQNNNTSKEDYRLFLRFLKETNVYCKFRECSINYKSEEFTLAKFLRCFENGSILNVVYSAPFFWGEDGCLPNFSFFWDKVSDNWKKYFKQNKRI